MQVTVRIISAAESHIGKPIPVELRPVPPIREPHRLTMLDRHWFDFSRIAGHRVA